MYEPSAFWLRSWRGISHLMKVVDVALYVLNSQAAKFPFSGAFLSHCEMRVLGYLRRYFG